MTELALAAFAAERGVHPRTEAKTARFAVFSKRFDARAYLDALSGEVRGQFDRLRRRDHVIVAAVQEEDRRARRR